MPVDLNIDEVYTSSCEEKDTDNTAAICETVIRYITAFNYNFQNDIQLMHLIYSKRIIKTP